MRLGPLSVHRERPRVISPRSLWVCVDWTGGYLYTSYTFLGLVWEVVSGWRKDRNLVG